MPLGKVLIKQDIPFENIQISLLDEWFLYPPKIQAEIDNLWEKKLKESEQQGNKMWDGNNYRMYGYSLNNGVLSLRFGYVKFRIVRFPLDSLSLDLAEYADNERGNGLFTAGFIESNDGYLVFGERSNKYLQKEGETTIIGGILQPDEVVVKGIEDVYDAFLKEIKEETNIDKESIINRKFIGITQSKNSNIGLIFSVKVNMSRDEILANFQRNKDGEMKNLVFVPVDSAAEVLEEIGKNNDHMKIFSQMF